jgi:ATP-dependent Clp protease ATP-binding subunit ClpA
MIHGRAVAEHLSYMLENFSRRARKVVIEARLDAGKRGADSMDVNSLVAALIVEDQDPKSLDLNEEDPAVKKLLEERMAQAKKVRHEKEPLLRLIMMPQECWKSREPFFAPDVAADLLTTLSKILPAFKSVAPSVEIRTSPEFMRAFEAAEGIRNEFHHAKVYPLHLLGAALREACEATKMLQEAGITEEKVLQTIRAGGDSEKGAADDPSANRTRP